MSANLRFFPFLFLYLLLFHNSIYAADDSFCDSIEMEVDNKKEFCSDYVDLLRAYNLPENAKFQDIEGWAARHKQDNNRSCLGLGLKRKFCVCSEVAGDSDVWERMKNWAYDNYGVISAVVIGGVSVALTAKKLFFDDKGDAVDERGNYFFYSRLSNALLPVGLSTGARDLGDGLVKKEKKSLHATGTYPPHRNPTKVYHHPIEELNEIVRSARDKTDIVIVHSLSINIKHYKSDDDVNKMIYLLSELLKMNAILELEIVGHMYCKNAIRVFSDGLLKNGSLKSLRIGLIFASESYGKIEKEVENFWLSVIEFLKKNDSLERISFVFSDKGIEDCRCPGEDCHCHCNWYFINPSEPILSRMQRMPPDSLIGIPPLSFSNNAKKWVKGNLNTPLFTPPDFTSELGFSVFFLMAMDFNEEKFLPLVRLGLLAPLHKFLSDDKDGLSSVSFYEYILGKLEKSILDLLCSSRRRGELTGLTVFLQDEPLDKCIKAIFSWFTCKVDDGDGLEREYINSLFLKLLDSRSDYKSKSHFLEKLWIFCETVLNISVEINEKRRNVLPDVLMVNEEREREEEEEEEEEEKEEETVVHASYAPNEKCLLNGDQTGGDERFQALNGATEEGHGLTHRFSKRHLEERRKNFVIYIFSQGFMRRALKAGEDYSPKSLLSFLSELVPAAEGVGGLDFRADVDDVRGLFAVYEEILSSTDSRIIDSYSFFLLAEITIAIFGGDDINVIIKYIQNRIEIKNERLSSLDRCLEVFKRFKKSGVLFYSEKDLDYFEILKAMIEEDGGGKEKEAIKWILKIINSIEKISTRK